MPPLSSPSSSPASSSSSSSPSPLTPDAVVSALRAAGCVFAEDEARLLVDAAATPGELAALLDRRGAGFPLEHVLGWVACSGLSIAVEPGVFVPRRRTEFLVEQALALAPGASADLDTRVEEYVRWLKA